MSKRKPGPGLTFDHLMSVERLSSVTVAPDGRTAVLVTTTADVAANRLRSTLKLLNLETHELRELTPSKAGGSQPAYSPDGTQLAFVSNREHGGAQVWVLPLAGGEARAVTNGRGGAASPVWASDNKRIAFSRKVIVSDALSAKAATGKQAPTRAQIYGLAHPASQAQVSDTLMFRHWDEWRDRHRAHVFVVDSVTGQCSDVTPGDWDSPPISLGSARDFAFSPDGKELAFVANPDTVIARSTNNCVFTQRLRGTKPLGKPKNIATSQASDCHPRYTADGSAIAYMAMAVTAYEADRSRIKLYNRRSGKTNTLLARFDRSVGQFQLTDDGAVVFLAQERGRQQLFRVALSGGKVSQLTSGDNIRAFAMLTADEHLCVQDSTARPADLYHVSTETPIAPNLDNGPAAQTQAKVVSSKLTQFGTGIAKLGLAEAEDFWFRGADGDAVHGMFIYPPGFDSRRKYPLILLIHGGPQSAFLDEFHYRWSQQMFAAQGACVAVINPRGSTGYGQRFTDQIGNDWGGRCYQDLMLGTDFLLKKRRYLDSKRLAAAGASFGGYMVNWIEGHTNRFKALVCHDGIFSSETFAYTTEELWFPEFEHRGMPAKKRDNYLRQSPHLHAKKFKTPMLVIQGGQDFRCPMSEALGMFTALQLNGVESRFLHFPDEGHWIMQLANAQVWYDEVLSWLYNRIS